MSSTCAPSVSGPSCTQDGVAASTRLIGSRSGAGDLHRLGEALHDRVAAPAIRAVTGRSGVVGPGVGAVVVGVVGSPPPHAASTPPAIIVVRNVRRDHIADDDRAPCARVHPRRR